jgi:tRNA(Arg) A34 adenosine deaminase TadA
MGINEDMYFIVMAADLAREGVAQNEGGPFGCVIVKDGHVIGRGNNKVISTHDPTAHAEMVAIRDACRHLNSHQLSGCTIYTTCEPCPMCLGAIYWARPERIVYACTRDDAASINFDDDFIYKEISTPLNQRKIPTQQCGQAIGLEVFRLWSEKNDKIGY